MNQEELETILSIGVVLLFLAACVNIWWILNGWPFGKDFDAQIEAIIRRMVMRFLQRREADPTVGTQASIGQLKPDQRNPRRHSPRNIGLVVDSLQQVGFARSIVIDEDGTILAGNGVTEAAGLAGIERVIEVEGDGETIIAVRRRGLTDEQKVKMKYYDNRASELADWDPAVVVSDLELGLDLSGMWSPDELSVMLEGAAGELLGGDGTPPPDIDPQIDRAEELQKKWQVKPGDIFQMGQHFVICGDCREADTWARLLKAAGVKKVNGVFTSPPYAEQRKQQYGGVPTAEYVEWWEAVQGNVRANLAGDGSFFVNIKPHSLEGERDVYVFDLVLTMVRRWGWRFVDELCWKQAGIPGDPVKMKRFKNQFEPVYHFSLGEHKFIPQSVMFESDTAILDDNYQPGFTRTFQGKGGNPFGKREIGRGLVYPGNVLEVHTIEGTGHEAAFPTQLPTFFIKAYSDPGDVWLDPFCGSGTSIIAAHNEKRRGLGIERLEKYVSVILQRFVDTTGKDPVLLSKSENSE